jgi:hypothetical protein
VSPVRLPGFVLAFSVVGVAGLYFVGRAMAGPTVGVTAALVYAALPVNLEILGWAGYANVYALALTPFLWWSLAHLRKKFSHQGVWLAALLASAIALVHVLTAMIVGVALGLAAAVDLIQSKDRVRLLRTYAYVLGAAMLISLPTLYYAVRNYTPENESLAFWSLDLTAVTRPNMDDYMRFFPGLVLGLAALGAARLLLARRNSYVVYLALALLIVSAGIAYSWILGFTFYYERALYFMALPLSLLAAYALWTLKWPAGRAALVMVVVGALALTSAETPSRVANYYSVLDPDSMAAIEWVRDHSSPDDVVVTDGCLAFLWEYIGQRQTAAAFNPIYLSSSAEEAVASEARLILQEPGRSAELIKAHGVQYVMFDAACPSLNPRKVMENLSQHELLKQRALFGSVYIFETVRPV